MTLSALLIMLPSAAFSSETEPEIKYDNGVVSLENNGQDGKVLIGAQYDDSGMMTKVKLYDAKDSISVAGDFIAGASVKFMLWDDLTHMHSAAAALDAEIESPSVLNEGESYGWIISVGDNDAGKTVVKLMTKNGAADYPIADDISVWLPGQTEPGIPSDGYVGNSQTNPAKIDNAADAIKEIHKYETQTDENGAVSVTNPADYLMSEYYMRDYNEIRLVKYMTNADGELSELYYAVDASAVDNKDALRIDKSDFSATPAFCGMVGGYLISDGITEFNVPDSREAMSDPDNYSIGRVKASNYVVFENGSTRNYTVGGFMNDVQPTFLINFMHISNEPEPFTNMDSAGAGPDMMLVSGIEPREADKKGNPVYQINGNLNGKDVSVTTNINTNIGQIQSNFWSSQFRNFDVNTIWSTADNGAVSPNTVLSKGDTVLYMANGKLIAKYISASDLYEYVINGTELDPNPLGAHQNNSSSRVGFCFGALTDVGQAGMIWAKLDGVNSAVFMPEDKNINLVEINKNTGEVNIVNDGIKPGELLTFDSETKTGDFMYVSTANKGNLKDVTVYRFTGGTREPKSFDAPKPLSKLKDGEIYGWIMSAGDSADGGKAVLKIMTADGAADYTVADNAEVWLPGAAQPGCGGSVADAVKNAEYTKLTDYYGSERENEIRLVKFALNTDGEISKLYYAVNSSITNDENALAVDTYDLQGTPAQLGAVGGYLIADGITEFNVPNNVSDMNDDSNYSVKDVKASEYVVPENGTTRSFVVAEFVNGYDATVIINFTPSSRTAEEFTAMPSAGAGPSAMVVDSIETDADGVYTIVGHMDGVEQRVRTNRNTNVGWIPNNFWTSTNNGRNFDAFSLWTAETGYLKWVSDPEAPEANEIVSSDVPIGDIADILGEGDLILYTSDGKLIAKYIDAGVMADYVENGEAASGFPKITYSQPTNRDPLATRMITFNPLGQHTNNSSSRVGYVFGKLTDVISANGTDVLKMEGISLKIPVTNDKFIDLVTVSGGEVNYDTDGIAANELKSGDYVYASTANKGMLNNVVVYRFTD